jgi:lipopolysaccharide transport protein LptA
LALAATVWAADPPPAEVKPAATGPTPEAIALKPAKAEPTVVTADKLTADYTHNTGTFECNVLVVDPRITVRADKMIVLFGLATNTTQRSVDSITATGNVVITQQDRKSKSDQAVYTAPDGKVVLTGKPEVETPDGKVAGETITFWRDSQKMEVESSTRLVIYPEELKQKETPPAPETAPAPKTATNSPPAKPNP